MRIKASVTAISLLLFSIAGPLLANRGVGSIELSSNPRTIPADGRSLATITAEVRDRDGNLVPDGTEIRFTASVGVIEDTATTTTGTVRVRLTSANIPGACVVTATWVEGQAVTQLNVEFEMVGSAAMKGPEYIAVDADDYVSYSIDHKVLEALGNVRMRYRSLELEAYEAQVNLGTGRIVARSQDRDHPVKVKTADGTIEGDMFSCDIVASRGLLLSAKTGAVQVVDFTKGMPVISSEEAVYSPEEFDMVHIADSAILVKAKGATVFPNQKILFKRANVYLETKRTISLPNYVLSLTGYPEEGEQYVGYSTGGLTLNLPFYYALAPRSNGALLVRHNESTGWGTYGQRPGWFIDLRQKYETDRSQGTFTLNRVTDSDWGAQYWHSQNLGNLTNAYMFLDYPAHRSPYGQVNLNRAFQGFNANLNLYGSKNSETGVRALQGILNLQTRPKQIGKTGLRYTVSTTFQKSGSYGAPVVDSTGAVISTTQTDSSEQLHGSMYSSPWKLGSGLSLRGSMGFGYVWGRPEIRGLSALASTVLDWKIAKNSQLQLNYSFNDRPNSRITRTVVRPGNQIEEITQTIQNTRQNVSAMLRLGDGQKWQASVYAYKGLDYNVMNVLSYLSYRISPLWRVGVNSSISAAGKSRYDDLELEVGHMLGNRELIAVWSQSERKIMFELGSGGF